MILRKATRDDVAEIVRLLAEDDLGADFTEIDHLIHFKRSPNSLEIDQ